jgi:hypothetical protein
MLCIHFISQDKPIRRQLERWACRREKKWAVNLAILHACSNVGRVQGMQGRVGYSYSGVHPARCLLQVRHRTLNSHPHAILFPHFMQIRLLHASQAGRAAGREVCPRLGQVHQFGSGASCKTNLLYLFTSLSLFYSAAYQLQIEFPDFKPTLQQLKMLNLLPTVNVFKLLLMSDKKSSLLPQSMCRNPKINTDDTYLRILTAFEKLHTMEPAYASLLYIVDVQQCVGYGEEAFTCKAC